jgi:hypothetical protein
MATELGLQELDVVPHVLRFQYLVDQHQPPHDVADGSLLPGIGDT